jgi:acetyltransferase-like isoleucine patch superfamily enzyme
LEPEEINKNELMEYYGLHGRFGYFRLAIRFANTWILNLISKNSPTPNLTCSLQRLRGVHIGEHVYIGPDVVIDDLYPGLVTIEDYVSIGMRTMIFAHSNPTCSIDLKTKYFPRTVRPVKISKGAWIAPGCIILAGVTIGENSVVGAGSLVTKDVDPNTVVAGSPARLVRKLEK